MVQGDGDKSLAPMHLSALFLPDMIARKNGHLVFMCSVSGFLATSFETTYTVSKFGLRGFSMALAGEGLQNMASPPRPSTRSGQIRASQIQLIWNQKREKAKSASYHKAGKDRQDSNRRYKKEKTPCVCRSVYQVILVAYQILAHCRQTAGRMIFYHRVWEKGNILIFLSENVYITGGSNGIGAGIAGTPGRHLNSVDQMKGVGIIDALAAVVESLIRDVPEISMLFSKEVFYELKVNTVIERAGMYRLRCMRKSL